MHGRKQFGGFLYQSLRGFEGQLAVLEAAQDTASKASTILRSVIVNGAVGIEKLHAGLREVGFSFFFQNVKSKLSHGLDFARIQRNAGKKRAVAAHGAATAKGLA